MYKDDKIKKLSSQLCDVLADIKSTMTEIAGNTYAEGFSDAIAIVANYKFSLPLSPDNARDAISRELEYKLAKREQRR